MIIKEMDEVGFKKGSSFLSSLNQIKKNEGATFTSFWNHIKMYPQTALHGESPHLCHASSVRMQGSTPGCWKHRSYSVGLTQIAVGVV